MSVNKNIILDARGLVKKFGRLVAVDKVSLTLNKGEILGLLGPNGAGKTTIIQMLLGLLAPTDGTVSYFGHNLKTHREQILERVNFSSTYTNFPWNFKVREVLHFISYLYDLTDRAAALKRIEKTFNLTELLDQQIHELSAGQLTRLNLAKAFINEPQVLLLDEPTASLDPDIAEQIRQTLLKERRQRELSIIVTSHNMAEVEELCDRVIVINHGRIMANDTPENLAKTIDICQVTLMAPKQAALEKLCRQQGFKFEIEAQFVTVAVPEHDLATFIQTLSTQKIKYNEISIAKPTLEDYFLAVAQASKAKPV